MASHFHFPSFLSAESAQIGMGKMSQMAAGQYGRNNLGNSNYYFKNWVNWNWMKAIFSLIDWGKDSSTTVWFGRIIWCKFDGIFCGEIWGQGHGHLFILFMNFKATILIYLTSVLAVHFLYIFSTTTLLGWGINIHSGQMGLRNVGVDGGSNAAACRQMEEISRK
jgi:hypothetical protein